MKNHPIYNINKIKSILLHESVKFAKKELCIKLNISCGTFYRLVNGECVSDKIVYRIINNLKLNEQDFLLPDSNC